MGRAAELAAGHLSEMTRVATLRDRLEAGILARIDLTAVNGRTDSRLPNTTNIGFSRSKPRPYYCCSASVASAQRRGGV